MARSAFTATARAVGVVVGDDEELLALRDRIGEENRGLTHVRQPLRRRERMERGGELLDRGEPARGEEARKPRIAAAGHEPRARRLVDRALDDLRHGAGRRGGTSASATRA